MTIVNFIENFRKKKRVLFTTPSHGQGDFVAPSSLKLLGHKFFTCDYSEIEGFDNLSNPIGIIRTSQVEAARIYGAKSTFFLTNGSTSGIVASMFALLNRCDKVLIARNCHKSVYNGLVLTGAVPLWLMPNYNKEWGIYETISLDLLEETFIRNKDIKAFIMTNPTYEGVMSDIYRVSSICKKYNVKLIVDEAHGALWNYHKALGTPALMQGADIVVQSLHKTAGALNPAALLHIGVDSDIEPKNIQKALNLFTTTSPSYPLLVNIESTINYLSSQQGQLKIQEMVKNVNRTVRFLKSIPNLEVYSYNNDVTKILVKVTNMSGFELSDILFNEYNIEDELANDKSVMFLTGLGTTKSKLKKLEKALFDLCAKNIKITPNEEIENPVINIEPRVRYTPALLWGKPSREVDLKYSLARVSMELIADYPPGIPILLPGEVIKKEHIEYLKDRQKIKVLM
ncbi:TPA: aminotransferase class I/II-fold pyridoxal phosphate-dependent enzyme [Candidatus Avigastranaerophilus faecigallinarum]|nr:aminotransferase class I/II-fold pyridoxal phosphate-dependent enzyme [Candidatus Avigastranaerophilus faecigallinarum]